MNFVSLMLTVIAMVSVSSGLPQITPQNNCVSFSVGPGTGCSWMCSYCADQLGRGGKAQQSLIKNVLLWDFWLSWAL